MKNIIVLVATSIVIIAGIAFYISKADNGKVTGTTNTSNPVTVENGTQYIDITANAGYTPNKVTAEAGMPTVLRLATKGTFDCSSSVIISSLDFQKQLQPTGVEEVSIPSDKAQGKLTGICGMGMYSFEIAFQS